MAAGLDEDLEIWSSGLKLSVDANAIKHMHAIFEPVFGRIFSENTVQQAQTPVSPGRKRKQALARAASLKTMVGAGTGVDVEGRRGALVGSLWLLMRATKEKEAAQRAMEGSDEAVDDDEDFNGCRIKWARSLLEQRGRCLLLVRLHVECVTVDVIKAIDDEEESPRSSLLEQVLRVHIVGNTFHAVTLNSRLARAQMVRRDGYTLPSFVCTLVVRIHLGS